jgi:hypothetical protein
MIESNSGMKQKSSGDEGWCAWVLSTLLFGLIIGVVGGYVSSYNAFHWTRTGHGIASGWELGVMFWTFFSAVACSITAIIGAWITRAISKPWWLGAILGGLVGLIGMASWAFIEAPKDPTITYSDHEGYEGNVNSNNCSAFGWAADPDDRRRDLEIRVLADDDPIPVATTVADHTRGDVYICTEYITCGFNVNLWGLISVGETHQITVQAYDLETGGWVNLRNTPRKLTCSRYFEGFHDGNDGNVVSSTCSAYGWVVDPDDRERDLEIRILADDDPVPVATTVAYHLRRGESECTEATCRFNVNLSGVISANETHQITVQAYDLETESWVNLHNTPKNLTCWVYP